MGMEAGTMYDVASYSDEAWRGLGDAIRRRRVALGMTQDELAEAAVVAVGTIRNLEKGRKVRHLTLPKITRALGWVNDSYILVLEGGPPILEEPEAEQDDALRLERPQNISDEEWEQISADLVADFQHYLRTRRRN